MIGMVFALFVRILHLFLNFAPFLILEKRCNLHFGISVIFGRSLCKFLDGFQSVYRAKND